MSLFEKFVLSLSCLAGFALPFICAWMVYESSWDSCGFWVLEGYKGREEEVYLCASPYITMVMALPSAFLGFVVGYIVLLSYCPDSSDRREWWLETNLPS